MRHAVWPLVVVAVAATGCTMCPSPFDYSGPVPNGSAAQNNFCARSNGILPLDASPRPWPPIVRNGEEPDVAEPVPEEIAVAQYADEGVQ
jgi:hypothetical protein